MRPSFLSLLLAVSLSIGVRAQQPEPAKPATEETRLAPPTPPPQVTLVEPGLEPRQVLRITPAPDLVQTCRMRLLMNLTMKMGDQEVPNPSMPAILVTLTARVTGVTPEGDINYDLSVRDCHVEALPETPADMATMMNEALKPMSQLTGQCTVSGRGINKEVKFAFPEGQGADAAAALIGLSDQVSQISVPLPEEAVGKGARWTVKSKIKSQGMNVDQTTAYTLTDVREGTAFMDVVLEQAAATQQLTGPTVPPGAVLELESLKSSGSGTTELPLTMIAPTRSALKLATDLVMKITQSEQTSKVKQDIKLDMTWSPGEPAAPAPTAPTK